jgi:hypothetical protein
MMSKSALRRAAGMLKYKALYCWPYKFKQAKAKRLREQFRPKAFELPPIEPAGQPEIEIHMLCGKHHLDMGIWASWSFLRFLKNAILYVHSDGTLGEQEADLFQKIVPSACIITKPQADSHVKATVASIAPRLCEWRESNLFAPQLIDMNLFGNRDRFLMLDADVLCFSVPVELRTALMDGELVFRWAQDLRSCYMAPLPVLREMTHLKVPEAVNLGPMITPRLREEDFVYLEHLFGRLQTEPTINLKISWAPQTLYAVCAARCPQSRPLSRTYAVKLGRTSNKAVLRHYVSIPAIRPRFFTEGIPKLLSNLH